jgi:hypothetical protein
MNTIGKTLVGLNLVFALVTGGFLVYDFAARKDWREAAEHNLQAFEVAQSSRDSAIAMARDALAQKKQLQAALDSQLIESGAKFSKLDYQMQSLLRELKEAKARASEALINQDKALEEAKRRQKEVEVLQDVVEKRQKEIRTAQEEAIKYRNEKVASDEAARVAVLRTQELLKRLQEYERKLAEQDKGGPGATAVAVNSPNYTNPPSAYVKGKIEEIDPKDRTLVKITLGSDVGVNENNTLEVYRMQPRAEYLGRIRIVEAHHRNAIGRLIRSGVGAVPTLRVGDEVASTIR